MSPPIFEIKRTIHWPVTMVRRRKLTLAGPPPAPGEVNPRQWFEQNYYRKAVYRLAVETMINPQLLVDFMLPPNAVILDVGAFVGEWSAGIAPTGASRILAFEPSSRSREDLDMVARTLPVIEVLPYGLAGTDATAELALDGPASSVFDADQGNGTETIELRDVVRALEELDVDHIDLLKINIEGGEFDLLERLLEANWLPRVDRVMVQFHEWHPNAHLRRAAIRRQLRTTHVPSWNYPWLWELWIRRDALPRPSPWDAIVNGTTIARSGIG